MRPPFSQGFLSLLLVFSFPIFSTAEESSNFPRTGVENIIRGFNLFPELDADINEDETEPKLVEKPIKLPYQSFKDATLQDLGHHAGYFKLPRTRNARMFYFFFESRNNRSNDPVVVWLTGGPGCSGSIALFYENGPFHLTENLSLIWNDFGWDKVSNLIYVDQPIGTGFSYPSSNSEIRNSTNATSFDFYDFLKAFFQKHPQYVKNDFYITGESYAGHYIPAYSLQIHHENKNKKSKIFINIKGITKGNGLVNPKIQYQSYADYALEMKLINQSYYNRLKHQLLLCHMVPMDQPKASLEMLLRWMKDGRLWKVV